MKHCPSPLMHSIFKQQPGMLTPHSSSPEPAASKTATAPETTTSETGATESVVMKMSTMEKVTA